jgi:hypothetical protein
MGDLTPNPHLLNLKSFQGIEIVTAAVAVARIAAGAQNNARARRASQAIGIDQLPSFAAMADRMSSSV